MLLNDYATDRAPFPFSPAMKLTTRKIEKDNGEMMQKIPLQTSTKEGCNPLYTKHKTSRNTNQIVNFQLKRATSSRRYPMDPADFHTRSCRSIVQPSPPTAQQQQKQQQHNNHNSSAALLGKKLSACIHQQMLLSQAREEEVEIINKIDDQDDEKKKKRKDVQKNSPRMSQLDEAKILNTINKKDCHDKTKKEKRRILVLRHDDCGSIISEITMETAKNNSKSTDQNNNDAPPCKHVSIVPRRIKALQRKYSFDESTPAPSRLSHGNGIDNPSRRKRSSTSSSFNKPQRSKSTSTTTTAGETTTTTTTATTKKKSNRTTSRHFPNTNNSMTRITRPTKKQSNKALTMMLLPSTTNRRATCSRGSLKTSLEILKSNPTLYGSSSGIEVHHNNIRKNWSSLSIPSRLD